jgi:hypothetical protein
VAVLARHVDDLDRPHVVVADAGAVLAVAVRTPQMRRVRILAVAGARLDADDRGDGFERLRAAAVADEELAAEGRNRIVGRVKRLGSV